jgi:hypothetical protein
MDAPFLASMETLARLQENQLLHIEDTGQVHIDDSPSVCRFMVRRWRGDSRTRTITTLKSLFDRILTTLQSENAYLRAMEGMDKMPTVVKTDTEERRIGFLRMIELVRNASAGLEKLRTSSYAGDALVCTQIDCIQTCVTDTLGSINID